MTWIQTNSGKRFDIDDPRMDAISVNDIAHALARINRYNGHIRTDHYSVGEHSVRCALAADKLGLPIVVQMAVLLHDAHEAYIGDLTRPMKQWLAQRMQPHSKLVQQEHRIDTVIWLALVGELAEPVTHSAVKQIDDWMIGWERPRLLRPRNDWQITTPEILALKSWKQPEPVGWTPRRAKQLFLQRYRMLHQLLAAEQQAVEAVSELTESMKQVEAEAA